MRDSKDDECRYCGLGRHFLCLCPDNGRCCCGDGIHADNNDGLFSAIEDKGKPKQVGRPRLDAKELANPLASGRARAAAEHAIEEGAICDWAGLKLAGGGVRPIVGCKANPATDLHHGPDKNTLNNERQVNLHAICSVCHNRWHGDNNRYYSPERPKGGPYLPLPEYECKPHDPDTKATEAEIEFNDLLWKARRKARKKVVYGDEPEFIRPAGDGNATN